MPDVPVSALDRRQQKLVENARIALQNGNFDYAVEACGHVLRAVPGCVEVRRLVRPAQLRQFESKNRLLAKVRSGLSSTPFIFSSVNKDPLKSLGSAEKILAADPTSASALKLLAEAAMALDFPETAAFAREAAQEQEPDDHGNLLELGEAWLAAGRPQEALRTADTLLKLKPLDSAAQNLMRKAAIAQTSRDSGWDGRTTTAGKAGVGAQAEGRAPVKLTIAPEVELRRELAAAVAVVAREPEHLDHYRVIVDRCRRLGEPAEALAWLRKARKLPAGAVDMALEKQESELSVALLEVQVKAAESALLASPGDPDVQARMTAAKRELASFRLFEARSNVERRPNDLAARQVLGMLYLERGQFDEAIAQFQEAQKDPAVRTAALFGLARAFRAKKLYELAVTQFVLVKSEPGPLDDRKKEIIYQLGECYELLGRKEQAIAEFKAIYAEDVIYRDVAARINAYYGK
jgi:tetratricopeptide (TPR) repeat protein